MSEPDGNGPPLVFGPVPSRRLGRSIGINNIPPKVCSFGCVYCQVGPTLDRLTDRRAFFLPEQVAAAVAARVTEVRARGEEVDYVTFVPDGEPTLDAGLATTLGLLRPLGVPRAVITNASLLWRDDVRAALADAEWVSVKVDAVIEDLWKRVNRPDPSLDLATVLDGIAAFSVEFTGDLVAETMLVAGLNDTPESLEAVGAFLRDVGIHRSYLSIPTRPTPYAGVGAPDEDTVNRAYQTLARWVPEVEYLVGYEGDAFSSTGDARTDLLGITAVHPMRASAVRELVERSGATWGVVDALVAEGLLTPTIYRDETYYVRRFSRQTA